MFGVPTYLFILTMLTLIATGLIRYMSGGYTPEEVHIVTQSTNETLLFVILRAFASGCTALTGVEAVSNGVPNFRPPQQRNAKFVLLAMAGFVCVIFLGVSVLISLYRIVPNEHATAVSQLAAAVFGGGSPMYYVVQVMTVVILTLAANTAYADLPLLMALMANDGYLPRRLIYRGSRLNYSNGILFLFGAAAVLVIAFRGDQHLLLPLYASGVFISFLLSQLGMLRHWLRCRGRGWRYKAAINGFGTCVTAFVLAIIVWMKFLSGAWVTLLTIAGLVALMLGIRQHYAAVSADLQVDDPMEILRAPRSGKAIVPVQSINRSCLKALNCVRDIGFTDIELYHVCADEESAKRLRAQIETLGVKAAFVYDVTHLRDTEEVLMRHIEAENAKLGPHEHLTVIMPKLVVTDPWKRYLHNQTTHRLIRRMEKYRNVYVFQVPYLI
jgi:hypothetical protein